MKRAKTTFHNFLLISFLLTSFLACKNHNTPKETMYIVSGTVTKTVPYCGGAQPTAEMLERLKKPVPYASKSFYIKTVSDDYSNQKVLLNFVSDSLGGFSIQISSGKYALFLEEQINKIDFDGLKNISVDQDCYDNWSAVPYSTFEVKNESVLNLAYHFSKKCFIIEDIPCLIYTGPRPQ